MAVNCKRKADGAEDDNGGRQEDGRRKLRARWQRLI